MPVLLGGTSKLWEEVDWNYQLMSLDRNTHLYCYFQPLPGWSRLLWLRVLSSLLCAEVCYKGCHSCFSCFAIKSPLCRNNLKCCIEGQTTFKKGKGKISLQAPRRGRKGWNTFDSLLLSQQHFLLGSFMVHLHTYFFISPDSCRFNNCFILVNSSLQLQQSLIWCSGKFLLLSVVRKAIYFWDLNWCERAHTNLLSTNSSLFVLSSWLHPWLRTQIF